MKVIIKTLNDKGRAALLWHWREEQAFRKKINSMPRFLRTKQMRQFAKTTSIMKHDREIITGFEHFNQEEIEFFKKSVGEAMKANGAQEGDYEVIFDDRKQQETIQTEQ